MLNMGLILATHRKVRIELVFVHDLEHWDKESVSTWSSQRLDLTKCLCVLVRQIRRGMSSGIEVIVKSLEVGFNPGDVHVLVDLFVSVRRAPDMIMKMHTTSSFSLSAIFSSMASGCSTGRTRISASLAAMP